MASEEHAAGYLFGLLALQMGFVDRDDVIAALTRHAQGTGADFGREIAANARLSTARRTLIDAAVREHLSLPGAVRSPNGSVVKSGAAGETLSTQASIEAAPKELTAAISELSVGPALADATCGFTLAAEVGSRFQVLRSHARGGIGEISVALDRELHREVALKQILPHFADDHSSRIRFVLEAEVTGRLEHPGIVPVYGLGEDIGGRPFYAMRFVKGESLSQAVDALYAENSVQRAGREPAILALRTLLNQLVVVCNAVEYAHSRGIIHRDIKPANILLGPYGETLIVDWGLAKVVGRPDPQTAPAEATLRPATPSGSSETKLGTVIGTPAYMSPEQAEGRTDDVGAASDVYSLGATLYFVLTGKPPFAGKDIVDILMRVRQGQFPSPARANPSVSAGLDAICLKAMARRPEDRYGSARDLASDLERWLGDEPVAAYSEPITARLARWGRRHKTLVSGGAILGLTALVALLISTILIGREQAHTERALQQLLRVQRERALARVDALLRTNAQALPTLINEFAPERSWIDPRLRELLRQDLAPEQVRRIRLGLLPVDPSQAEALGRDLPDCGVDEFAVVRDNLRPHRDRLTGPLWATFRDPSQSSHRRFFAGMALAGFEPDSQAWSAADDDFLTIQLLDAGPDDQRALRGFLEPIARRLIPPLRAKFSDEASRESAREAAAMALAEYARNEPVLLADIASRSSAEQYLLLLPALKEQSANHGELIAALAAIAGDHGRTEIAESRSLSDGRRRARAAITLFELNEPPKALLAFCGPEHPDSGAQFVHQVRERGVRPADLAAALDGTEASGARYVLLLALGEYPLAEFAEPARSRLLNRVRDLHALDPSSTIHGASGWLLRAWGRQREADTVDRTPAPDDAKSSRTWFVEAFGDDRLLFVVCPRGQYLMGSPPTEADRDNDEDRHPVELTRPFAIGAHEVTERQFQRFLKATNAEAGRSDLDGRGPAMNLSWYEAVSYCRWLTRQAGMTEADQCYDDPATLPKGPDGFPKDWPMHPERRGFRLPTEAEWEYACRGGTATTFSFGSDRSLLRHYGWYQDNSGRGPHTVGELRPNLFGISDMYGNAVEWCNDRFIGYSAGLVRDPLGGAESEFRVYRGGAWSGGPRLCRSADRDLGSPTDRAFLGFRLARSVPPRH